MSWYFIPDEMKQKKTILRKNGSLKFCEAGAKKSLKSLKRFVYQGIFVMTTYNLAEIFVCIQFRYPHNSSYGTRNFCYTNRSGDYLLNRTLLKFKTSIFSKNCFFLLHLIWDWLMQWGVTNLLWKTQHLYGPVLARYCIFSEERAEDDL